ncbi:MAG: MoxR family ATPase [Deltaproteobacteria bacterium]|nr:MAG: MoxR family ATPase [Deltaproteobacteria bacterium]
MDVKERVAHFKRATDRLKNEVGKIIVGQGEIVDGVVTALLAGGHALLEGVPGLGKTRLVRTLADALDLEFSRVQFTPDLMPSDITGTKVAIQDDAGHTVLDFQKGPIFANIVLADEINRATPRTQSAMLEAMQERSVTVGRQTYELAHPFFVLATQNPLEMDGTYPLPEAQLDRFLFKLHVTYPSADELHTILDRTTGWDAPKIEQVMDQQGVMELRHLAMDVPVARHVQDYAVRIVMATHPTHKEAPEIACRYIRIGASPRGAQAIIVASKVRAVLDGRFAVSAQDVRAVARPALRHRIIRNFEGEAEGVSTDSILDDILRVIKESG